MRLTSREAREYRREMIVRLYESGKSQKEISNLVSVDQSVVSRVVQDYRFGKSLKETVNKGAPIKLSSRSQERLKALIDSGAESAGFQGDHWTGVRLARVVKERFDVSYSPSGILKLIKRMGYSKQRYQQIDKRQPDVTEWKQKKLPAIKKKLDKNSG